MLRDYSIIVAAADTGERLDRFVAERTGSPRSLVLEAIAAGRIRVNGRRASKGNEVSAGDCVQIEKLPERGDVRARADPAVPLAVLHEDAHLLVLDKPAGMPVHPLRLDETGTLANGLVARYGELAELGDRPLMAGLVHRIDTDTSGVVLAARTAKAFDNLRRQFRRHEVRKTYLALVHGRVDSPGSIRSHLAHDRGHRGRMIVVPEASRAGRIAPAGERPLPAVTEFRPLRQCPAPADQATAGDTPGLRPPCTLLEVTIYTGVTHQIRCQLAALGHPVVGDRTYGLGAALDAHLARHFLHASAIAFRHPRTAEPVRFESKLPAELETLLEKMQ